MRTVTVNRRLATSIAEAEGCWYDTSRWPSWIDGVDRVLGVTGNWPGVGSSVVWESGPAGRGRVAERVVAYEARRGQTVEVEDPSIRGRQTVAFVATEDGAEVSLSLEYRLVRRSIVSPIVDLFFIRRAMVNSLGLTLSHFAAQLAAPRRGRAPDPEH